MNEFDTSTKPTVKDSVSTLKDNASTLKDNVSTLVDQGSATVDAIKTRVGDVTTSIKEGGAAAIDKTTSFVEENPYKAIGIAFGLGYVLMRIRTSPLTKLALIGGLGYLGVTKFHR